MQNELNNGVVFETRNPEMARSVNLTQQTCNRNTELDPLLSQYAVLRKYYNNLNILVNRSTNNRVIQYTVGETEYIIEGDDPKTAKVYIKSQNHQLIFDNQKVETLEDLLNIILVAHSINQSNQLMER